ncbi:sulfite exporter TauE/SafE family protein [Sphingobium sp. BHU LFT2]|uniref:sulfite exporter TauE/SafE family protein n=1 Tax=Sphingobium sp. BHU LFT2 TaxID=2807634 RepID=UPI001BEA8B74|nr:sulfite exporter TauE/SafE family protein [Sphingobium sp. BHU LFT2]MBT2245866.1 sulfite exporter TauE/SafE family protein [Sphingobium sp. BHU LFT2]
MFDYSLSLFAAIVATFFVAGVVKGVTGMGLPTVAMGVLGSLLSPLAAAALLLVPSFVTNVWQLLAGPRFAMLVRRLWPMMLTIVLGTVFGSMLLTGGQTELTTIGLGVALIIYAAYTLLAKPLHVSAKWEPWLSPVVGLVTGLVTGATGVFVIPAVPYIQSLDLERDYLVQALGLSFTISTIALGIGLFWHDAAPVGNLLTSTLAIVPALLGMAAGQVIRERISAQLFRRLFLIFLLLLGLEMALHGLL